MTNLAIRIERLSKVYKLVSGEPAADTFREAITAAAMAPLRRFRELGGNGRTSEDFWALKDVSFDVQPGEVVGIVGRNGAGKSTLLKVLSRIVEPTSGRAVLNGRVASLLEVGTGFHPELTGRENIYLNGSILGMRRREIQSKFHEIVAFAEIERFLDTPVKRYSSGMYVRLAFAVAAHLEPEILIVDEVLAVGDAEFQKRCLGKMREVSRGGGRTVLFVSHNMAAVSSLCSRAVLLVKGSVVMDDTPSRVIQEYLIPATGDGGDVVDLSAAMGRSSRVVPHFRSLRMQDDDGVAARAFLPGQEVTFELGLTLPNALRSPRVGMGVNNARGERVFAVATYLSQTPVDRVVGESKLGVRFQLPPLYPGRYTVDISIAAEEGPFLDEVESAASFEVMQDGYLGSSHPYFPEMGAVLVRSQWAVRS